jgi:hypothetical protein
MIMGHAAGVAASLVIRDGKSFQDIPVNELQKILASQDAVFEYVPSDPVSAVSSLALATRIIAPLRKPP